jgi:hypothetical protein
LSLCTERITLERIQHMLTTGKPLRNWRLLIFDFLIIK